MKLPLRWQVFLLVLGVTLVSLAVAGLQVARATVETLRHHIGLQQLAVAQAVAELEVVREWVGKPTGAAHIDPVVESIRLRSGLEILVVFDTDSIRYAHPVKERIGQTFVGGDEQRALQGEEYISTAVGTLGPSQRAFAPIFNEAGTVIGAVAAGGLIPSVEAQLTPLRGAIFAAVAIGLAIGSIGAGLLGSHIKQTLFGMEPDEIASVLHAREALLQSVREGIIAVDKNGAITLINDVAKDYLEVGNEVLGLPVDQVVANSRLPQVVNTGQAEYDQEQQMGPVRVLTNRVPIIVEGRVMGAVATFRDHSEVARLAEELSGVRRYIEALRVQTHEFSNKLHTISGLIQLGNHDDAVEYIHTVQSMHTGLTDTISARINDPGIAAIIIGKIGRATELGIKLDLTEDSHLENLPVELRQWLTVIIGNLMDNSLEALSASGRENPLVTARISQTDEYIDLEIMDNGPGIPDTWRDRIFEFGFSTKSSLNRGLGLHIAHRIVTDLGGSIDLTSDPYVLTNFAIKIPIKSEG